MRPLVILRPEPGASRTAAKAAAMGLSVRIIPLFTIAPLGWTAPDPAGFDGMILTSANAIRHGGAELEKLKQLPVHAVGKATAQLAHAAGFRIAQVGEGGVTDLRLPEGDKLIHLAGRAHAETGADVTIAVYEARPIDRPAGITALGGCVAAVHSPAAGRRFGELAPDRSTIIIAAISLGAAEACSSGWQKVEAASEPSDDALLALAARLCESPIP